ncbi:TonB-dependent receptor domain-containing protein [Sphingobium scionense]|uniref:Outer membrane receptor protein involved in Fe transport n=2 Tax=Sphingobium TaxID=165695 RepID=A0A7W6LWV8_9SPHN|nr:outer membrane receptor protein involved in Fe transport [Sphingobium scionense]
MAIGTLVPATAAFAEDQRRIEYNIEGGDLGEALKAISRLSGKDIIFHSEAVLGKSATKLHGSYSADEAVRTLIQGTGLRAQFRKDVIIIRGRSEPSGDLADRPAVDGEILVTGSRIRGAPPTSPVTVARREEIEKQGASDLGSYIRLLPQNFNGGQNPNVAGGGAQGNNNNVSSSSTLNLRGLGPDATLTLLNGHRLAYDALAQGVDISSIPLAAVDRVEVVADGASALYGSDAVGGVANIILRPEFRGAEISARLATTTDGGGRQAQLSAVTGTTWSDGGFMLAADYTSSRRISAGQRSYTSLMDQSATLVPSVKQISIVATGHQRMAEGVEFKIDGTFSRRNSKYDNPFLNTGSVTENGLRSNPIVRTYSISPSLTVALTPAWSLNFSGTIADSKADLHSRRYSASVETPGRLIYSNDLRALEAGVQGPLTELPGGEVKLAAGGGIRSLGLGVQVSNTPHGSPTIVTEQFHTRRAVQFAYGELTIPIFGAGNSKPLLYRLDLTAAGRFEHYEAVGSVATPKFGFRYAPSPDLSLMGSWGRSFKAPTLYQQNQIRQGVLLPGVIFSDNPSGLPVLLLAGGGTPLRAEKAETWTATVSLTPRSVPGLHLQASYFDVAYKDRVSVPIVGATAALSNPIYANLVRLSPSATAVEAEIVRLPQGLSNFSGSAFDAANIAAIIDGTDRNVARQNARGVDVSGRYKFSFSGSQTLEISANASYLESRRQVATGLPSSQLAGTIFNPPNWRMEGGFTYSLSSFDASLFANYIGGTSDTRTLPDVHVGSFTSLDGTLRYRTERGNGIFAGTEIVLSVLNLLNEKPAQIQNSDPSLPPYDSTNYSAIGRQISVTLRKRI